MVLTRIEAEADSIRIDGRLDEPVWERLPVHATLYVIEPDTLVEGRYPTEVRIFYTSRGLYVGAHMTQPKNTLIARLSSRDGFMTLRDEFSFTLDTSGEGRYGFWFGIGLGGSVSDGAVLPERQYVNDWDGPWRGNTAETEDGWSAEMFVPWGIVSMPNAPDIRRMGIYVSRRVAHLNERWAYPALPFTRPQFLSVLQPVEMRNVEPRRQYNIYPFSAVWTDYIDNQTRTRTGADLFWRPNTNTQLLGTLFPDFGTVESDQVIVNLTASETFYPEKRLFFLEGQEVFVATPRAEVRRRGIGNPGPPYTMIYTRRIGGAPQPPELPPDTTVSQRELRQLTELNGAAKVTGQSGRIRYGVLGAFEDGVKFDAVQNGNDINLHQDGSNYGVGRVLYEDTLGGAYRALGFMSTAAMHYDGDAYAQGVDWHYFTPSSKFKTDGQAFVSDIDDEERGYGGFWDFEYTFRQGVIQRLGIEAFDRNIDLNDVGFLPRRDNYRIRSSHQRTTSKLSWARDNELDIRGFLQENGDGYFTGGGVTLTNRTTFFNLSALTLGGAYSPRSYDDLNSFGNGTYKVDQHGEANVLLESDPAKPWSYAVGAGFRGELLGGNTYFGEAWLDWQPDDKFSASIGTMYFNRHGWLLHQEGPNMTTFNADQWQPEARIEYFITARQQLRAALQWVGIKAHEDEFFLIPSDPGNLIPTAKPPGPSDDFSYSQMSLQIRYRWEIAPLSDLFVVYTRLVDRGAALTDQSFEDVFNDSYDAPLVNVFVVKLRYRFGS